jgi:methylated-DNA-[protein]-cysteine S-methyltransferase
LKNALLENPESGIEFEKTLFKTAQEQITAYFEGACIDFRNIPIILDGFSPFQRSVLNACRDIGFGRTVSYLGLARKSGRPAAARAVGGALAKNPLPLIIPCHRIVRSNGKIGGFSAAGGEDLKAQLLKNERAALIDCKSN